jgi:hypothetical protein
MSCHHIKPYPGVVEAFGFVVLTPLPDVSPHPNSMWCGRSLRLRCHHTQPQCGVVLSTYPGEVKAFVGVSLPPHVLKFSLKEKLVPIDFKKKLKPFIFFLKRALPG